MPPVIEQRVQATVHCAPPPAVVDEITVPAEHNVPMPAQPVMEQEEHFEIIMEDDLPDWQDDDDDIQQR